jgi:regulator of RNase E activity RraA
MCTSPFIQRETIEEALKVVENGEYDSVVLIKKEAVYEWEKGKPKYDKDRIPNRAEMDQRIVEAMGMYVVDGSVASTLKRRIGNKPYMLQGAPIDLIDIKTPEDLYLSRTIAAGIRAEENKYLRLLKTFLNSAILSDICDELGLDCVLPPEYVSNIPRVKLLGRARTLKIREALRSDPPDAIYEALEAYKYVDDNDVLVVGTECPDVAYFGDLNMSLAIRSGASGAIIGGVTRDTVRTHIAHFPVFAKGRYCKDVKSRGALEGINVPLEIDGIKLNYGDLIFADDDGIVVIPNRHEDTIIERALEVVSKEASIIASILKKDSTDEMIDKHGYF